VENSGFIKREKNSSDTFPGNERLRGKKSSGGGGVFVRKN